MDFRLLNSVQIGETAPSDAVLHGLHAAEGALVGFKQKHTSAVAGTSDSIHALEALVMKHLSSKTGEGLPNQENIVVDWDAVAFDVGDRITRLPPLPLSSPSPSPSLQPLPRSLQLSL
jgi:hypothetical protein